MDWEQPHSEQEEEFQYLPQPEILLSLQKDIEYNSELLIIAQYGPASLFAHSLIGSQSPANKLNFSKAKQSALADLYQQNEGRTLFLIFNDSPEPMKDIFLTKFLQQKIKSKRIILLLAVSKNTLKNSNLSPLTSIYTSSSEHIHLPRFEEGITGIFADVLAWGEINRASVTGFIGSFGEYELSSNIIQQNFGLLRGRYGLQGNFDISERVKKYNMKKYSNKLYL